MTIVIRAFREPDNAALPSLVGPHTDPLWHDQFHTLHGPDSSEPWSRTLTAADSETGQIVGAATLSARTLHPARSACAIDVHPDHRRKGTGAALLQTLRSQFPNRFPAMTKVVASNTAAVGFLASSHATIYQVVPAFTIALARTSPNPPFSLPPGIAITGLDTMPTEVLEDAFVSMYTWTHERWNPVSSPSDLQQAARHEVAEVAPNLSSGAWKDGEPLAIAFVFPDGDGNAEIAAETVRRKVPDGRAILKAILQHTIDRARNAGIERLLFDGHVSDPHLFPVLQEIATDRDPKNDLLFAEISAGLTYSPEQNR